MSVADIASSPISSYWDKTVVGYTCNEPRNQDFAILTLNSFFDIVIYTWPAHYLYKLNLPFKARAELIIAFSIGLVYVSQSYIFLPPTDGSQQSWALIRPSIPPHHHVQHRRMDALWPTWRINYHRGIARRHHLRIATILAVPLRIRLHKLSVEVCIRRHQRAHQGEAQRPQSWQSPICRTGR